MIDRAAPVQASSGAVVLFSGGMDSTVCLYRAIRRFPGRVRALTIDYGQRSGALEIEAAGAIVTPLGVPWDVVAIDVPWWRSTGLVAGGSVEGAAAVVPGRNTPLGAEQCGECGACRQRAVGFGGAP